MTSIQRVIPYSPMGRLAFGDEGEDSLEIVRIDARRLWEMYEDGLLTVRNAELSLDGRNRLIVDAKNCDPQLILSVDLESMYVDSINVEWESKCRSTPSSVTLYWSTENARNFSEDSRVLDCTPNGRLQRTASLSVAASRGWQKRITRLRLDTGELPGQYVISSVRLVKKGVGRIEPVRIEGRLLSGLPDIATRSGAGLLLLRLGPSGNRRRRSRRFLRFLKGKNLRKGQRLPSGEVRLHIGQESVPAALQRVGDEYVAVFFFPDPSVLDGSVWMEARGVETKEVEWATVTRAWDARRFTMDCVRFGHEWRTAIPLWAGQAVEFDIPESIDRDGELNFETCSRQKTDADGPALSALLPGERPSALETSNEWSPCTLKLKGAGRICIKAGEAQGITGAVPTYLTAQERRFQETECCSDSC